MRAQRSRRHHRITELNAKADHGISYDYQLTYLHGNSRDVMGEISGNRVRISIPSLIDNFGRNVMEDMMVTLNVILLHELSHWGDERDYGNDFGHSPAWNALLVGLTYGN